MILSYWNTNERLGAGSGIWRSGGAGQAQQGAKEALVVQVRRQPARHKVT